MVILHLMAKLLLIISVIIIGSRPVYNENFAIVQGTLSEGQNDYEAHINLPNGFNNNNCIILSVMTGNPSNNNWGFGTVFNSASYVGGGALVMASLKNDNTMCVRMRNIQFNVGTEQTAYVGKGAEFKFKVILMKLPTGNDATLLGDVDQDGQFTQEDYSLIEGYDVELNGLNFQQYANADMNKDGRVNSEDMLEWLREHGNN